MYINIMRLLKACENIAETAPGYLQHLFWSELKTAAESDISILNPYFGRFKNPYSRLEKLLKARKYIIKMADKNAGLTVMPYNWYVNQCYDHLKDVDTYKKMDNNPTNTILSQLKQLCDKHANKTTRWFDAEKHKIQIPLFYVMPKVHKTPVGIRPIIPSHSWYTTTAAKWLHNKLFPLVERYDWIVTDRLQLIQELEEHSFNYVSKKPYLGTIDVTALYTSIDLNTGLAIIKTALNTKHKDLFNIKEIEFVMDLLRWVLENNYFKFGKDIFKQIKGAAMGGNVSGVFADLVLAEFEDTWLAKNLAGIGNKLTPYFYKRYRDDVFIVSKTLSEANGFVNLLNTTKFLKFNLEQIGCSVNYLDLTIFFGNRWDLRKLNLKPYTKPTTKKEFTHYSTYKPECTKNSWITGETIRVLRASHSAKDFNKEIKSFRHKLAAAQYPPRVIRAHTRYEFTDRRWLITKQINKEYAWLPTSNTRMSHCTWNFLQNNFKPILDANNIKITASKGITTLDRINTTVKKILNPIPARNAAFDKFIEKRLANHKNKPLIVADKRQQDILAEINTQPKKISKRLLQLKWRNNKPLLPSTLQEPDNGIHTTANQTMRKRDRSREALSDLNTSGRVTSTSLPTFSPRIPDKNNNRLSKKPRSEQGQHQNINPATAEQPSRRPDEAKSETRSHGMTKSHLPRN